jgi:general secretion pathway protein H
MYAPLCPLLSPGGLPLAWDRLRPQGRSRARGMTLLEIMVVMIIIAVLVVGIVGGTGQLGGARVRHTATAIAGAVKVSYTRATATSKSLRLVFDLDKSTMWLEEGDAPMLVQTKDRTGTGGADPATDAERAAIDEGADILKGPKVARAHFHPVSGISMTADEVTAGKDGAPTSGKGPIPMPRGVTFRQIQAAHDDDARTKGRAYLYFWPGGLTERASIQIRLGQSTEDGDTLTLEVSPLTGKVTVKNGPVALVLPTNDKEASEREDNGAF